MPRASLGFIAAYLAGIVVALTLMRDPWPARVGTALLWPLGPIAFLAVVTILSIAAVFLWPVPVLGIIAAIAALIWVVGC